MPVDLLVFGPHPDDLEIGLGGTIARHAALGLRVGLCDLTAGEMGSNGTRRGAAGARRRPPALVLGAAWRENLRWPDRRIGKDPAHLEEAVAFIRRHRPRTVAVPVLVGSPSRSWRGQRACSPRRCSTPACGATPRRRRGVEGRVDLLLLHQRLAPRRRSWSTCREHYDRKRAALDCHASQFQRGRPGAAATRLNTPLFRQLVESRDAQFGALAGVPLGRGVRRARADCCVATLSARGSRPRD